MNFDTAWRKIDELCLYPQSPDFAGAVEDLRNAITEGVTLGEMTQPQADSLLSLLP